MQSHILGKRYLGGCVGPFAQNNDPGTLAANKHPPPRHQSGLGQQAQRLGVDLGGFPDPAHCGDAGTFVDQVDQVGDPQREVLVQRLPQLI